MSGRNSCSVAVAVPFLSVRSMKEVAGGDGEAAAAMLSNGLAARPSVGCALDVLQGDMYAGRYASSSPPRSTMMIFVQTSNN